MDTAEGKPTPYGSSDGADLVTAAAAWSRGLTTLRRPLEEEAMRPWIRSRDVAPWFLVGVFLCVTWSEAQAWGAKGHRIVGHMARGLLSPAARTAVQQLMGSDDL